MSILWAGGEDVSFYSITLSTTTSNTLYRPSFARGSLFFQTFGTVTNTTFPLSSYANTPQFGPIGQFWVHGQLAFAPNFNAIGLNALLLVIADSSSIPRLAIRGTSTNGQIKISTITAAGVFTDLVVSNLGALNYSLPNPNPSALDIFINYAVSGQVTVYWNGVNICDTGPGVNVTTDSVTGLGQVMYSIANLVNQAQGWSECIVSTTTTLGTALQTLPPVAAGNTQLWTGSVSNIDELAVNDANYNYTATAAQLSEWTVTTTLPTGTWGIQAVVQAGALSRGTTGPQHFAWDVRCSNAISYQSSAQNLSTGFGFYQYIWQTNPATSNPWNPGELINSGVESLA